MKYKKNAEKSGFSVRHIISIPFIWALLPSFVILDITIEIYHQICFRLYQIPLVKRRNYIKIDRNRLRYLKWYDKINCAYCGYANGLLHYAGVIAGETEKYWCAIKHQKQKGFVEPAHHKDFLEYGDEKGFRKEYGEK